MTIKNDAKFEGKLSLDSKNDMKGLVNFNTTAVALSKFALSRATFFNSICTFG